MNNGGTKKQAEKGFTLLEVLVAFSLLSVSLGVIMLGVSKSLKASEYTRDYTRAILLAESKITEYSVIDFPEVKKFIGRFDDRYEWEVNIQAYDETGFNNSGLLAVYQVMVRVTWPGQDKPRELVLSTLRLGPPGS